MDRNVKRQLGELMVDQDKLLDALSHSTAALDGFPELQDYLLRKNKQSVAYRKALRDNVFTKQDYKQAILAKLDWIGYELCLELDMDFLINRVAALVGDDISAIDDLTVNQLGAGNLSKLLHRMGEAVHKSVEAEPASFPFLESKGHANPRFWKKADLAYELYVDGYSTHWKLNSAFKDKHDVGVPQSFIGFVKRYGSPKNLPQWVDWKEKQK